MFLYIRILTVEQDQSPSYNPGIKGVWPIRLLLIPCIRGCAWNRPRNARSRALIDLSLTIWRNRAICTLFSLFLFRLCNRKEKRVRRRLPKKLPFPTFFALLSFISFFLLFLFKKIKKKKNRNNKIEDLLRSEKSFLSNINLFVWLSLLWMGLINLLIAFRLSHLRV